MTQIVNNKVRAETTTGPSKKEHIFDLKVPGNCNIRPVVETFS